MDPSSSFATNIKHKLTMMIAHSTVLKLAY